MTDARAGSTDVSVTALVTVRALAIVPFVLVTPEGPIAEIDSCGENVGSFSYWFNFASKLAPLAHIQITNTGSSAVPVMVDVAVRYSPAINMRRWKSIPTISHKYFTTSVTPFLQALDQELFS
jgi:hypothetical protein